MKKIKLLRNWFLRVIVYRKYAIGKGFYAGKGARLWAKSQLEIGYNFYMGCYSQIECNAIIGNNVIFGNRVSLAGRYDHHYQQVGRPIAHSQRIRNTDYTWKELGNRVEIGDDVWVGIGSIVLSGVVIGEGSIIAAGSVVTRDIEPYSIYAGVPARKVGMRFMSEEDLIEHKRLVGLEVSKIRFSGPIPY